MDARLKIGALGLDAVHSAALGHALLFGAQGHAQKQGCVRHQVCGGPAAQVNNSVHPEIAAHALVGGGRIDVAVAEHNRSPGECGANQLSRVRGAGGREDERLGAVVNSTLARLEHEGA